MADKVTVPSPYEPRLREIAARINQRMLTTSEPFIDSILAVLRSNLDIESLMETISAVVEAPNVPHPAALRKLREWRDKWKS